MARDNPRLSVVMPTMNEQDSIEKVVADIRKNTKGLDVEILIVDSSEDDTPDMAKKLGLKVIRQEPQGPGVALILGLEKSLGDVVITSDCDDTYPMEDIPRFLELHSEGYEFVNGNRLNQMNKSMPPLNRFGNWLFAFLVRRLYGIPIYDLTTGMRLFTRRLIESEKWETNYSFWAEVVIKSQRRGFKFAEIPIMYRTRIGEVKLNVARSGWAFLACIFKYRFRLNFIDPKKL